MSKILGSWSGMRNYLEKEMLAECLRGWSYVNILDTKSQTFLCCTSS